jgi:UDP-N-acetylglucosamine 4,6-dehydratase
MAKPSPLDWSAAGVLVTGGTGSFGRRFVETVLRLHPPRRLIVFSRDEWKQSQMQQELSHPCLRYFIGDVRDRDRLLRAFAGVDVVIHAAALKQVPTAEYNPFEAIKTNVLGAQNVIEAAIDRGVTRVLALSSDKAANPINLYGATKLCADKLFVAGNSYVGEAPAIFSVVRYGNVLGSRGSVVPLFERQRAAGAVTLTDPAMTRFWITLEQAVAFVLACLDRMHGGEIFVPKIPSSTLADMAAAVAPGCRQEVIGLRAGEKLHEVLIPTDESHRTLEYDGYYVVQPEFDYWSPEKWVGGRPVAADFRYSSENNPWRLSPAELKGLLP